MNVDIDELFRELSQDTIPENASERIKRNVESEFNASSDTAHKDRERERLQNEQLIKKNQLLLKQLKNNKAKVARDNNVSIADKRKVLRAEMEMARLRLDELIGEESIATGLTQARDQLQNNSVFGKSKTIVRDRLRKKLQTRQKNQDNINNIINF